MVSTVLNTLNCLVFLVEHLGVSANMSYSKGCGYKDSDNSKVHAEMGLEMKLA